MLCNANNSMNLQNPIIQSLLVAVGVAGLLMVAKPSALYTPSGQIKNTNMTPVHAGLLVGIMWLGFQVIVKGKAVGFGGSIGQFRSSTQSSFDGVSGASMGSSFASTARAGVASADTFYE
jgi:hypothetical protein